MQEYLVKKGDRIEVMAMLGVYGAIISAIQMYLSIVSFFCSMHELKIEL
jgi:Solute carrier family 35